VTSVAIAFGSNLGDREQHLRDAVAALGAVISDLHVSSLHETDPVGVAPQPRFLNAAAVGLTSLSPDDLLAAMLAVEARFGRKRPYEGAPRTLDLDLILYGSEIVDRPGLTIPHPRFRERRFVLEPLAEVAGSWRDPVSGLTVADLLARLDA
jgi:2-amino-4-hydroxy-6-hydroxymethyldihydropteridine diphosphokinase